MNMNFIVIRMNGRGIIMSTIAMSEARYKIWELDFHENNEYVIARDLTFGEAMIMIKIHPEGFPRRMEKESDSDE
jgi:hypothetical protein